MSKEWDYVVIGAGSAGCAVANRLSKSGSANVLLLEAGGYPSRLSKVLGLAEHFDLARYDWGYTSVPDPSRGGKNERWLRGRVVGGTSSINGTNYVRGSRADYDRWAMLGNQGWDADQVMPFFRSLEHCEHRMGGGKSNGLRGHTGPVHIREVHGCHPITEAFIHSAQATGFEFNPDYNGPVQEGVGYAQLTQRRGLRCSAADAYLKPILRRKNLQLMTQTQVHRLIISGNRVASVEGESNGQTRTISAKNIILSAGAINTPKLLLLSGVGESDALRKLGIRCVLNHRSVGTNLMEHPLVRLVARARKPTYNPTEGLLQKVGWAAKFLLTGQGPLASFIESQAFIRSAPGLAEPDLQIHFSPLGLGYAMDEPYHLLPYPSITILINKNRPSSRGRVRLANADPRAAPLIEPNMLGDTRDLETLVQGLATIRGVLSSHPIAKMLTEEVHPGLSCNTPAGLQDYVRRHTEGAYHPSGTCRMGMDEDAVVTPQLQVRGLDNCWVADASVMPELISGNINGACMMIGERLGRFLNGAMNSYSSGRT